MSRASHDHQDPRALAHDDTRNRTIVLWGTVTVIILAVMLVWLRGFFFSVRNEVVNDTVLRIDNPKLLEQRAREDAQLGSYAWVNKEQGVVQIPIERAMELVVQESAARGGGR